MIPPGLICQAVRQTPSASSMTKMSIDRGRPSPSHTTYARHLHPERMAVLA